MPKTNDSGMIIPKLYKRKYEDLGMLFFVEGQKQIVPTITLEQALYNYARFTGLDDFNIECARVTLSRMRAEFIDLNYTK